MQVLTCGVTDLVVSQAVSDELAPLAAKGTENSGLDGGSGGGSEPASRAAGSGSLGEPLQRRLGQGAAVVSLDLPQAPVTCVDFWCRAGSAAETPDESGLAHFLEHMVFKGSERLGAGEFDLRVEALGGSSNAATGFDDVHYHVLVPPSAAAEAIDLLLDLVLAPRLDGQDFDMERQVVLEELAQSEDQPEEVAFQQLLSRACPGHAYGQPILGRREALEGHQAEAMAAFHQRLYRADNCCLAVAGPLGDGAILEHLEHSALSRLASADQPRSSSTGPASSGTRSEAAPLQLQPGSDTVVLPRLEAARLLMAWQVPPAGDLEVVIGCALLTTLLAEGPLGIEQGCQVAPEPLGIPMGQGIERCLDRLMPAPQVVVAQQAGHRASRL